MPVVTERVALRRVTPDDAGRLVELDSDPEVMRYLTGGVPTPLAEIVDDIIPAWLDYHERFTSYGFWLAEARDDGRFLGWFHLRPQAGLPVDEPEIGYRLHRREWGKGFAPEVCRALIDLAFSELGAVRVYAGTMAVNTASRRVMEKVGLRFARAYHEDFPYAIDGSEQGEVEYELTFEEWVAGRERPT